MKKHLQSLTWCTIGQDISCITWTIWWCDESTSQDRDTNSWNIRAKTYHWCIEITQSSSQRYLSIWLKRLSSLSYHPYLSCNHQRPPYQHTVQNVLHIKQMLFSNWEKRSKQIFLTDSKNVWTMGWSGMSSHILCIQQDIIVIKNYLFPLCD